MRWREVGKEMVCARGVLRRYDNKQRAETRVREV